MMIRGTLFTFPLSFHQVLFRTYVYCPGLACVFCYLISDHVLVSPRFAVAWFRCALVSLSPLRIHFAESCGSVHISACLYMIGRA